MDKTFDVVIIGSGPGGYVCAIRCAGLGMKTAIVEKYKRLGGTCLNVGCIPSKAWLDSSEKYADLLHNFKHHGISPGKVVLDFKKMRGRVEKVVEDVGGGVDFLMKKNKISVFHGHASFRDPHTVEIKGEKQSREISGTHIVIATGSKPATLAGIAIDKKRIITSTEALYLESLPKSLAVVGGGVIGCELASVFGRLGTKVDIVEYADSLITTMDRELGRELGKVFARDGMSVHTGFSVSEIEKKKDTLVLKAHGKQTKGELEIKAQLCLMAVGRRAYTEGLNLSAIGVRLDEGGRIVTDQRLKTNHPHIYAIGDATKGVMLAHKASEEGVFVAETLAGEKPHFNPDLIPSVVYTWPEAAGIGKTEEELKKDKIPYKAGRFPFKALGRARASGESNGLVKVLAHAKSDEILGIHMIGPRCADMIAEAVTAMEFRAASEDIARSCHAHPTYSEALKEACLAASLGKALHL